MIDSSALLTCITDDGEIFAVVSSDQRVRCFETGTGIEHGDQIRLPTGHIPHCISSRRRLLAIGMTSGSVVICDLSKGVVVHEVNAHRDCIHDLCFDSNASRLYMCSNDGQCSEWDVSTSSMVRRRQFRPSKRSITKSISISQDSSMLACGSSTIRLIDAPSLKTVAKLRGHASNIVAMRFNAAGDVLFSIAHADRSVNSFRITTKSKERVDASVCYMLKDVPRSFTVGAKAIACILETGDVAIFDIGQVKASKLKSVTEFRTLSCAGSARAVHFSSDVSLLVAGGHIAEPVFKSSSIDESRDLSPFETATGPEKAPRKHGRTEAPVEVVSITVKKAKTDAAPAAITSNETIPLPLDGSNGAVTADSMITLLSQGLKSNDNQKLSLVLDQSRNSFITSTVARLPPALIPSFVTVLVKRIRTSSKPKHLANTMNWMQCLLQQHTAYLLGNTAVADQLAEAKLLLENRQRSASSLMALAGRLTLLQCQLQQTQTLTNESLAQPTVFVHDVNEQ